MENTTLNQTGGTKIGSFVSIPTIWAYSSVAVCSVITFLIVTGNLLVIIAFLTTPKLKTKTNYFIFSLAIADLLVGLFSVPLWIYVVLSLDFSSLLYQYYKLADTLSGSSSILHLTCVSVERCYAIVAPLKHRKIRKVTIYSGIVLSWLLAILSAALLKIMISKWTDIPVFITFAFFIVPLILIIAAYITIFITARKSFQGQRKMSLKRELHIAYTVALITGVFVICWLPFFLTILLFKWCGVKCAEFVYDMRVIMIVKILHYGNSALNPIVYAVKNRNFNHAFKMILKKLFFQNSYSRHLVMKSPCQNSMRSHFDSRPAKTMAVMSLHNSEEEVREMITATTTTTTTTTPQINDLIG
ncbi:PREDICTED: tyramine/octopamine receptor-like isoform X2 [Acropora digitifera]|uniref:tyramine/octopamine receptor-like isoform X2 n=1 Tax=Acropora digitifera TaxID=70779 RepID=UPI00077ABC6E|nr:PREDICTED: tyramine/octopamine receptor-like isoform X2 [Acropora digitifera]